MKTARNQIFFSCLIDLTLYVLKTIHARKMQQSQNLYPFARQFFFETLAKAPEEVFESLDREKVTLDFEKHLIRLDWSGTDDSYEFFSGSRSALLKWAPVVEKFKIQDEEIVSNSIHFKWLRVCQEFEKLINFEEFHLETGPDFPDQEKEIPNDS